MSLSKILERIEESIPAIAEARDSEHLFNVCITSINEQCENAPEDREWLLQIIILMLCRGIAYKNGESNKDLKTMAREILKNGKGK